MIHSRLRFFVTCDKCGETIETNAANEVIADREAERKGWKCVVTYSYSGAYHPPVYTNYCPKCKEEKK